MAIRARAGAVGFLLRNTGRETANPPIVFPSVTPTAHFTWSMWVYVTHPSIPATINVHSHTDGSQVAFGHDGFTWYFTSREEAVGFPTQYLRAIIFDTWTLIGLVKDGPNFRVFMGVQDPANLTPWDDPVVVEEMFITSPDITAEFDYIVLQTTSNNGICGFKFWNYSLTLAEFTSQAQSWNPTDGIGPRPFWVSPLRVPGDLSNVQYPYADTNWGHGHAYTQINLPSNLTTITDPAYMANSTYCNAWLYPTVFPNIFVDPGLTPLVPTTYKAPQFYEFADVGSIATEDFQIQSIVYYGSAFGGVDSGTPFIECWALYKDELGVEIATMADPAYRFVPGDTGVVIPPGSTGVPKAKTVYLWKFGGQFIWNPVTPQGPTNTAHLAYLLLYVTYLGYPTGIPSLPVQDLTGLFAIRRDGIAIDKYNRGVEKMIPRPVIRTAYIGE